MNAFEARKLLRKPTPAGYRMMFCVHLIDVEEPHTHYAHTLADALKPLKVLGFQCNNGDIVGVIGDDTTTVAVNCGGGQPVPKEEVEAAWKLIPAPRLYTVTATVCVLAEDSKSAEQALKELLPPQPFVPWYQAQVSAKLSD